MDRVSAALGCIALLSSSGDNHPACRCGTAEQTIICPVICLEGVTMFSRGTGVPWKHNPGWCNLQLTPVQELLTPPSNSLVLFSENLLFSVFSSGQWRENIHSFGAHAFKNPIFIYIFPLSWVFFFLTSTHENKLITSCRRELQHNMSRCRSGKVKTWSSELPKQSDVNLARHVGTEKKPPDFIRFLNKLQMFWHKHVIYSKSLFFKAQCVTFIDLP